MTESVPKVANRKVWEDVLSVMRIRTFQIIVLQVRLLRVFWSLGVRGAGLQAPLCNLPVLRIYSE